MFFVALLDICTIYLFIKQNSDPESSKKKELKILVYKFSILYVEVISQLNDTLFLGRAKNNNSLGKHILVLC